jgi:hypothetical protein
MRVSAPDDIGAEERVRFDEDLQTFVPVTLVTDANGKPYRFGMTGSAGESDAPTVTCFRCGDTIPKATAICTSIADCVNFKIRSKWIIPGDGK